MTNLNEFLGEEIKIDRITFYALILWTGIGAAYTVTTLLGWLID